MLTDEQKLENKTKYLQLLDQAGIKTPELEAYLESINYFDAPATAQYQGAYSGGLTEYALKLAHEMGVLCNTYFPGKYTAEDILKVALTKELYRSIMYEPYFRNVKNEETGQWEKVAAYRTKEDRQVYGDLGFSSYMSLRNMVNFTDEQLEAIIHSTGLNNYAVDIHDVLKQYPLVTITKMADLAISNF